jgi:uncharacterized protein (DUF4415 family)
MKDYIDPDDAPDLTTPNWSKKLAATRVKRGRTKLETIKVSASRLSGDVLEKHRVQGPKWQSQMNQVLRVWWKLLWTRLVGFALLLCAMGIYAVASRWVRW